MIELRHLRYFVAVAEEGHMTRAAQRLGLQQPPLSQQIRALEEAVGARLFHRRPRGVTLTEAGAALLERARPILRDVPLALEAARRAARGEEGRLAIGFTHSAAFHPLVAAVVRGMRQAAPGIALVLEEGTSAELAATLREGRLDAAFLRASAEEESGLCAERLLEEEMLLALPDPYPPARAWAPGAAEHPIPLAALAGETFILPRRPSGPGLYDSIIAACRAAGFSPRVGQEAPRLVSTLSLVAAGLGLSIVPRSMAHLQTEGIAYRRLAAGVAPRAPLFLAWRESQPMGALARFLALARQEKAARGWR
ncbi:LysR family transcriptional regulator [Roseomonas sp. GC11]|uniref:LysR family transcriptional regulator n=1 Tax=Roseomonas sp. GC11 TaxID=2950546 RepID=UPI00210DD11A|nr:LysR family transcriptional regulator [Roseomonas sp. GC11]